MVLSTHMGSCRILRDETGTSYRCNQAQGAAEIGASVDMTQHLLGNDNSGAHNGT